MKKYRSKKALIEDIEALRNTGDYAKAILFDMTISIIVFKECIKSDCDYIDVTYNEKTKILSGRPVYLLSDFKKSILNSDEDIGLYATMEDLTFQISKRRVKLEHLHKWFEGIAANSYHLQEFTTMEIPVFIKELEAGSFKECVCKNNLSVPTHLLIQLARAGLDLSEKCKVKLLRSGSFGLNDLVKTTYAGIENRIDYIDYQSLFKADEYIRVYENKLTLIRKEKEIKFINNFYYKKFYNSADEVIICLLLAYYRIIVTTDVTLGLLDLYQEIDNKSLDKIN